MAALEMSEYERYEEFDTVAPVDLRVVTTPLRHGPSLAVRRAARARMLRRRRRTLAVLAILAGLTILAWPGHAFGGVNGAGLSSDVANSSVLASGQSYVVQPGDTVASIARAMNPANPAFARTVLVRALGSSVVVAGEHVLIP